MKIEPFFSASEMLVSYLVSDERTRSAVMVNLGDVSQTLIRRLSQVKLNTILICDNRPSVQKNIDLIRRIYPFSFHEFSHTQRFLELGELEIEMIDVPEHSTTVFRINDVLFTGNMDISPILGSLDEDLVLLPSNGPVSTVGNMLRLEAFHQELSIPK